MAIKSYTVQGTENFSADSWRWVFMWAKKPLLFQHPETRHTVRVTNPALASQLHDVGYAWRTYDKEIAFLPGVATHVDNQLAFVRDAYF